MSPLPMVSTVMVTMKHLTTIPDFRENSSCESDIDRQELIDNYGSEKYLSKWNLDVDDESGGVAAGEFLHQQDFDHKQSESELHRLTIDDDDNDDDDDDASLVSYNSVRDAGAPGKNKASYLPYQIQPLAQDITLWQGYGGNIYFDPLRCQPMRINSSKPHKQKPKDSKSCRKTKSCSPSMEVLTARHYIPSGASSFHSLGSLCFASRGEKRRNTSCISDYGRLRKGYSEGKIQEPNSSTSNRRVQCESAPESLIISGGQRKDVTSDPIEHVFKCNIKARLKSKCKDNLPSLVLEQKFDSERDRDNRDIHLETSTNLPPVETVAPGKHVAEPKPVFIIPFGALDDPVEGNNSKPVGETSSKRNAIKKKSKVDDVAISSDSHVIAHSRHCNEPEPALSAVESTKQQAGRTGNVDRVRREISDASLSNYLQAVPTHLSKEKKRIPKLSYTKRVVEMDPGSLSMSSMTNVDLRISSTTTLYGGYLPSTRSADTTHLFRAERNSASHTGETNLPESLDERRLLSIKPRKRNDNGHVPPSKHRQYSDKCHLPIIGWHVS